MRIVVRAATLVKPGGPLRLFVSLWLARLPIGEPRHYRLEIALTTEEPSEDQQRLLDNPELVKRMEKTAADPDSRDRTRGRPNRERTVDLIGQEAS